VGGESICHAPHVPFFLLGAEGELCVGLGLSTMDDSQDAKPSFPVLLKKSLQNKYQSILDSSVPYLKLRWFLLVGLMALYGIRVYLLQGFYIVTYGLALSLLNLLIGFLSPLDVDEDLGSLPTNDKDEYKPFVRKLPEFKFWYECSVAVSVAFVFTFFGLFNVPVFWPILLIYFIILFFLTMRKQIRHMRTHNYIPFSFGKKKYGDATSIIDDVRSK
jgi:hypothetical protein